MLRRRLKSQHGHDADLKLGLYQGWERANGWADQGDFIQNMECGNVGWEGGLYNPVWAYGKQINLGAMLNANVKRCIFTRTGAIILLWKLPGWRQCRVSVYDSHDSVCNDFLLSFKVYSAAQEALAVDGFICSISMCPLFRKRRPIFLLKSQSKSEGGAKPLGKRVPETLDEGIVPWIDVYENGGKTTRLSWKLQLSPYVMLPPKHSRILCLPWLWNGGTLCTAIFSNKNQIHLYAGYKIFVAEVASSLNESW